MGLSTHTINFHKNLAVVGKTSNRRGWVLDNLGSSTILTLSVVEENDSLNIVSVRKSGGLTITETLVKNVKSNKKNLLRILAFAQELANYFSKLSDEDSVVSNVGLLQTSNNKSNFAKIELSIHTLGKENDIVDSLICDFDIMDIVVEQNRQKYFDLLYSNVNLD